MCAGEGVPLLYDRLSPFECVDFETVVHVGH